MRARIDHFITSATRPLNEVLEIYKTLGFVVSPPERTMRHQPGLRTGFMYFSLINSTDYIEFLTVEHRDIFDAARAKGDHRWTEELTAQGLGIRMEDAPAIHAQLKEQGVRVKDVWSKKPEGAGDDEPLRWSFVELEDAAQLGSFYVEYLLKRPAPTSTDSIAGPNGIYAIAGFYVDYPDAEACYAALSRALPAAELEIIGDRVRFGCHELVPMPFESFVKTYGGAHADRLKRNPAMKLYATLLYSDDLAKTKPYFANSPKPWTEANGHLALLPSAFDGLTAVVAERPQAEWRAMRLDERFAF